MRFIFPRPGSPAHSQPQQAASQTRPLPVRLNQELELERTQPMLPIGLGYVEGVTHDYRRHGTTPLFAALGTARGRVITQCRKRHRPEEYLDFLREIDKDVPSKLDVHVVVDNDATHKHPRVKRWLAARPRFHVHFTPTYASWLNQVEPDHPASHSAGEHFAV